VLTGRQEAPMEATSKYHRLALDCLELAEAARNPAVREQMIRLAELWARMADGAERPDRDRRAA